MHHSTPTHPHSLASVSFDEMHGLTHTHAHTYTPTHIDAPHPSAKGVVGGMGGGVRRSDDDVLALRLKVRLCCVFCVLCSVFCVLCSVFCVLCCVCIRVYVYVCLHMCICACVRLCVCLSECVCSCL